MPRAHLPFFEHPNLLAQLNQAVKKITNLPQSPPAFPNFISLSRLTASFPLETSWNLLKPLETFWNLLKPIETSWNFLKPLETSWNFLKPLETYWIRLKPIETYYIKPIETSWNLLKPLETFWNLLKPLETSWNLLQPMVLGLLHFKKLPLNIMNWKQTILKFATDHVYANHYSKFMQMMGSTPHVLLLENKK